MYIQRGTGVLAGGLEGGATLVHESSQWNEELRIVL
jgi:hypothetical protein